MPSAALLEAIGLSAGCDDPRVAERMREIAGLDGPSRYPGLWVFLLEVLSGHLALPFGQQISDMGHLAWTTAQGSVKDESSRYSEANWRTELNVDDPHLGIFLSAIAGIVSRGIGPMFAAAGLSRAQSYGHHEPPAEPEEPRGE